MRISKRAVTGVAVMGVMAATAAVAPSVLAKPPASTISVVQFAPNNTALTATEGLPGGAKAFVINRSNSTGTAKFNVSPFDGSAHITDDYVPLWSNPVTISPGSTSTTLLLGIVNDTIAEPTETMGLNLTSADALTQVGKKNSAVVTITDNDPCPGVNVDDASATEGTPPPATGNPVTFTVSTVGAATCALPIQVHWATAATTTGGGVDATPGTDFVSGSGNVAIPAGATSATFNVLTVPDATDELDQTFKVLLSAPVNTNLVDGTGIGTINDDDAAPTVVMSDNPSATEGSDLVYTITLSAASEKDASGTVETWPGNPADTRYTPTGPTAWSIPAGGTSTTFHVPTTDDGAFQGADQVVWGHLLTATNATIPGFLCSISFPDWDCTTFGTDDAWSYGLLKDNDADFSSFETGLQDWTPYQDGDAPLGSISTDQANTGTHSMLLGTPANGCISEPTGVSGVYRSFTIPASGTSTLHYSVFEEGDNSGNFDDQFAELRDPSTDAVLTGGAIFHDGYANVGAWDSRTFDVTPFAGTTVRLFFGVYQDGLGCPSNMYVDDVFVTTV